MDIFLRRELIKTNSGYTLILYLDQQNAEFAEEISGIQNGISKKQHKDIFELIKNYISENYSDIKIDTIKILLGTTLIATIGITLISDSQTDPISIPADATAIAISDEISKSIGQKSPETESSNSMGMINDNKIIGQPIKDSSKADVNAENDLILVNKENELSKDYVPVRLVNPDVPSLNISKTKMAPEAAKALEKLFQKAKEDNISLVAASGYRSYSYQKQVFASNIIKYGSAATANQFSALPGESEHQTGLAMDVTSQSVGFTLVQSFAQTKEGIWLRVNAPAFGFIVRYPKYKEAITGYQSEPWHLRYVGTDASIKIAESNITLEEYLG